MKRLLTFAEDKLCPSERRNPKVVEAKELKTEKQNSKCNATDTQIHKVGSGG